MENNKLKNQIQKNVKERIAISNIREEINMNKEKSRKVVYSVLASCAMLALCVGILVTKTPYKESAIHQAKLENLKETKEELKTEININKIDKLLGIDYAIDAQRTKIDAIMETTDLRFAIECKLPSDFEENYDIYAMRVKGKNSNQYNELQQYDFYYGNKDKTRSITLAIAFKDKTPIRDYYFLNIEKKSKIGEVELEITQYEDSYLVIFSYKDVNYDIETHGITQDELIEFLKSLISNSKSYEQMTSKDQETQVKEPSKDNATTVYPNYYAGKYVDDNGKNVVLLCEDNETNREEICKILGITKSKTSFKTAKYSYDYLTQLQEKISKKMQNKELSFVTSSSLMEDTNNIKVIVITKNENDLNKLKELDTIGGAIEIKYSENGIATHELLISQ